MLTQLHSDWKCQNVSILIKHYHRDASHGAKQILLICKSEDANKSPLALVRSANDLKKQLHVSVSVYVRTLAGFFIEKSKYICYHCSDACAMDVRMQVYVV